MEDASRETESYSYGPIERVLGWTSGSVEQVLAGGEPTLAEVDDTERDDAEEQSSSGDEILRMIIQILRSRVGNDTKVRLIDRLIADEYQPGGAAQLSDGPRHVAG